MTGLTLPGHDRAALLELRQEDLGEARTRAGAHEAEVVRDLRQRDRDRLERARRLDERVAGGLGLERIGGREDRQAGLRRQTLAHPLGELGMRVEPGAGGRAAERDLPDARQRRLDPRAALLDLGRVAGELLAERHGDRVHQMRPPRLDDVVELGRLGLEGVAELLSAGSRSFSSSSRAARCTAEGKTSFEDCPMFT